jgi:hypothetical protein
MARPDVETPPDVESQGRNDLRLQRPGAPCDGDVDPPAPLEHALQQVGLRGQRAGHCQGGHERQCRLELQSSLHESFPMTFFPEPLNRILHMMTRPGFFQACDSFRVPWSRRPERSMRRAPPFGAVLSGLRGRRPGRRRSNVTEGKESGHGFTRPSAGLARVGEAQRGFHRRQGALPRALPQRTQTT